MRGVLKLGGVLLLSGVFSWLAGCAATQTALGHKDLEVQTKTSTAIFVDQVARADRTVYVSIRSGVMEFDRHAFMKFIKQQFAQNEEGYRIVDDPNAAQFQMNVYVLNLEKANPTAAEEALHRGYIGSVAAGATAGALVHSSNRYTGAAAGGLLGGVTDSISGALVHDVTYMLVVDVQIKEKARKGVIVRKDTQISAKVSDSGTSTQRVSEVGIRKEYQTRIVTTANKVNLDLPEAQDEMFNKTAYAMAGFF